MTLGVSNLPATNGAFAAAGLSQDGAMAAQNFLNVLLGQEEAPRSGGQAFLADVKDAKNPEEKRALIDGFAEGFAAASEGARTEGSRAECARRGTVETAEAGAAEAPEEASEQDTSPQALMRGFQQIADLVAESDLPKKAKNALLDGIATLMSQLKAEAPAGESAGSASSACAPAATNREAASGSEAPSPSSANGSEEGSSASAATQADTGPWTHEVEDGKATIRLGDKYTIRASESDATWTVTNNETGKETRVWGDPHVDQDNDGDTDFDFKKDMTFQLDDGTKITVGTVPGGENGTTFSSSLTITNGQNAIQVKGLGDSHDGKNNLEVTQSMEGETIDGLESDGASTIYENGGVWQTRAGKAVDQSIIDAAEAAAA